MTNLAKLGCWIALYWQVGTGLATAQRGIANLGPSGFPAVEIHSAPLDALKSRAELRGFRLKTVRWDSVLHQNWAVLEDIQHPERPLWAELTDPIGPLLEGVSGASRSDASVAFGARDAAALPKLAVIHYGQAVKLWRVEQNVRIEMTATAEGNAAVGDQVKLRIPGSGTEGDSGWRIIGVVRGPGDVEMER